MAIAAFQVNKYTGAAAATKNIAADAHVAFLNSDLHSVDTATYPVAIPSDILQTPNYSMETWLRFELTSLPDAYVQNVRVFGPSTQPDTPTNLISVMIGETATGVTPAVEGPVQNASQTVGTGLNDLESGGAYSGASNATFTVEIDGTGTPNTFRWKKDAGAWTSLVQITASDQILMEGVKIKFGATTGHISLDQWQFTTKAKTQGEEQHLLYFDSSNPNSLALQLEPGDNRLDAVGELTWYCVMQLQVRFGAGAKIGTMTFNLTYEEV